MMIAGVSERKGDSGGRCDGGDGGDASRKSTSTTEMYIMVHFDIISFNSSKVL